MKIKKINIKKLNPSKYNPRKDLQPEDIEYRKIKRSIEEFGYVDPIIVNSDMSVIGGHQRLKILKELEYEKIDCVIVDLDKTKEKALNIALNKIEGDWDLPKLKDILQEIDTGKFDIGITGFDNEEIEDLENKYAIQNIDDLLNELDLSEAIDEPIWLVIRTKKENQQLLEDTITQLEEKGIRIERNYEI